MHEGMENSSNTRQSFGRLAILIAVATIDLLGATMVFPQIPFYAQHCVRRPPQWRLGNLSESF